MQYSGWRKQRGPISESDVKMLAFALNSNFVGAYFIRKDNRLH